MIRSTDPQSFFKCLLSVPLLLSELDFFSCVRHVCTLLLTSLVACSSAVYAVTVTSEVIGGRQEALCAHIERLKQPINLTVALEVNSATTFLLEELVAQPFHRCIRFQVQFNFNLFV